MEEKICSFDILVNECFMHFNPDIDNITPDSNDFLLSVVNGFEDGQWRYGRFQDFIFDNITQTALNAEERKKCIDESYSTLKEAAKHLRLTEDKGKGSEIAEIVLYGIMRHYYNAISATPKIFHKQNDNDNAKGADSVHIVLTDDEDFELWLGEAKFYNSIDNKRFSEPLSSIEQMLTTDILRKEISVMISLPDLSDQIDNAQLVEKIKKALTTDVSIDFIKPHIHVPILLLHECNITAGAKELDETYKNAIINHHKERAVHFFKKQIKRLEGIAKYDSIQFHLILFPVPDKDKVVNSFLKKTRLFRDDD